MDYLVHVARVDGEVVSIPAGLREDAADLIATLVNGQYELGGHANVVHAGDDVLIVMIGMENEPVAALIAAPFNINFNDIIQQHISAGLSDADFTHVSISSADSDISIH